MAPDQIRIEYTSPVGVRGVVICSKTNRDEVVRGLIAEGYTMNQNVKG